MNDPHHNEYLAAVAAMPEHTVSGGTTRLIDGKLITTYAVGDRIYFIDQGRTLAGVVVGVLEQDKYDVRRHQPDVGDWHHTVHADQIAPY